MAGINRRFDGEYESSDKRGRTGEIFRLIDVGDILNGNRVRGFGVADDGVDTFSGWVQTQKTSGTVTNVSTGRGSVVQIDPGATTSGNGMNLQCGGGFTPAAGTTIAFECNVQTDLVRGSFFFGLAEVDTTTLTSSANTTSNHIGFESIAASGVFGFHSEKADTRVSTAGVHTLVAATEVLLGFRINGLSSVEVYVNRTKVTTTEITGSSIPIVGMAPTIVVQADGGRSVAKIDWVDCFQQDQGD